MLNYRGSREDYKVIRLLFNILMSANYFPIFFNILNLSKFEIVTFLLFFEKFEGDLARLALKFGVSGKAAEVRAKNLGLI